MDQVKIEQHFRLLDLKNEIERSKLIISGIKCDLGLCTNRNKLAKLKNKKFYMERKLRGLVLQKNKLEKEFKAERKEWF